MKIHRDKLDDLFSEVVRRRAVLESNGCQYCGKQTKSYLDLDCSHFIGRRKRSTRWCSDNAVGICRGCHFFLGEHPYEHTEFFKKRLGTERLEKLIIKSNTQFKPDRDKIEVVLREALRILKGGTDK